MVHEALPGYVEGFDPVLNLRDLGGWPTTDGRHVKRGLLFRSGRLCDLDTQELIRFQQLGLRCVVDLRPPEEAALRPDPKFPRIAYVSADAGRDVLDGEEVRDLPISEVVEAATRTTVAMAFGNQGITRLLGLLEDGRVPLLFHCNSGRDRSGVAAMVVLMALGCSDETLLADYELTNAYRAEALAYVFDRYQDLAQLGSSHRDLLTLMAGVLPQAGRAILSAIDARYPTRETYLATEYGLVPERLSNLRERLLD